uniref:UNC93-like protein n=1 Tax=Timema tahoe TaxID=61484 RepID=A0A7R9IJL6_9NEOP|nr:unnamed protein product [Timema tahoe]
MYGKTTQALRGLQPDQSALHQKGHRPTRSNELRPQRALERLPIIVSKNTSKVDLDDSDEFVDEFGFIAAGLPPGEERKIIVNLMSVSVAFTILYGAFRSMANLQTSMHAEKGLGSSSLAAIYASVVVSSLFLPAFLIRRLTVKWTMSLSMLGYSVFIAAQFYPRFYTLIPAGIVLGLCSAPMWISQATYVTHLAYVYSVVTKEKADMVIMRFYGIFFLFFETSQIWGNLVSSIVLSYSKYKPLPPDSEYLKRCGAEFCPQDKDKQHAHFLANHLKPAPEDLYTLATIYIVCALSSSAFIAVNVDSLRKYGEHERRASSTHVSVKFYKATLTHMKHPYSILLIPLSVWCGVEHGFITADYTQAFVNCAISIHHVGWVMMAYGVLASIFSMSLSPITEITGRIPVISFGAGLNLLLLFVMMHWRPTSTEPMLFYVIAAGWGMADVVWQTQLNGNNSRVADTAQRHSSTVTTPSPCLAWCGRHSSTVTIPSPCLTWCGRHSSTVNNSLSLSDVVWQTQLNGNNSLSLSDVVWQLNGNNSLSLSDVVWQTQLNGNNSFSLSDVVWQNQLNALVGTLFPTREEVAYSNYRLFEALGFAVAYAYSPYICVKPELYFLTGVLTVGMLGYIAVEILERRRKDDAVVRLTPDLRSHVSARQRQRPILVAESGVPSSSATQAELPGISFKLCFGQPPWSVGIEKRPSLHVDQVMPYPGRSSDIEAGVEPTTPAEEPSTVCACSDKLGSFYQNLVFLVMVIPVTLVVILDLLGSILTCCCLCRGDRLYKTRNFRLEYNMGCFSTLCFRFLTKRKDEESPEERRMVVE